jgi:hypothetical protein
MSVESRAEIIEGAEEPKALSLDDEEALDRGLEQIRDDISRGGHVDEARALVKELEARWPESERVQYWARVLAPPVVVPTPEAHRNVRPLDREHAWLQKHRRAYPGCWLAVHEDRLIAADPDLGVVLAEARRQLGSEGAVLYWQPGRAQGK